MIIRKKQVIPITTFSFQNLLTEQFPGILQITVLMKKRPVLHQLALLFIAAGVFFCAASAAHANTFTPPQQYSYPGLAFSTPLTYTHPLSLPEPTAVLSFATQNKLILNKTNLKKPLDDAIALTPTLAAIETTHLTIQQPTPTVIPTETPEPTVTTTPEPTQTTTTPPANYSPVPQANPGGLNAADLFNMVNSYRASLGLPAFQQDAKTCSLAAQRAPEVGGEIAAGDMHAGLKAMNLPYWNTENIISMNSDQAAFNWWINDPIHHAAIVSNNTYSCVACSGNSCAEEFTSYTAK